MDLRERRNHKIRVYECLKEKPYLVGKKLARIEKSIVSGELLLPLIVECLQANYSLSDYGLFFEGYNQEMGGN